MLFGGSQDENSVGRRFFQRFQERVEGRLGKHVYLVNDEDFIFALLRLKTDLVNQGTNVFHAVVRSRVELDDVERSVVVKGIARRAGIAGLEVRTGVLAVEYFGQYSGTSSLAYPPRAAKEEGLRQMVVAQRVLQRRRDMLLPCYVLKARRPVFSCGNNKTAQCLVKI